MIKALLSTAHLSDEALTVEVHRHAARERQATAGLVALLAEFDARRPYLCAGCSSLFAGSVEEFRVFRD